MGVDSTDAYGKPVFNDAFSLPGDLSALADYVDPFANTRRGTSADRQALTPGKLRPGLLFPETDTGVVPMWNGTKWIRRAFASGTVVCPSTGGSGSTPVFWSPLIDVTFPVGVFTAPPQVQVQTVGPAGQVPFGGMVEQITATGCKVRGFRVGSPPDSLFSVAWTAVQPS